MDKQLAQHRTQEQGSRIAAAAHLNYEFAMYTLICSVLRPSCHLMFFVIWPSPTPR
jgi:5-formyltetrahydrofolate cyclo-ligase